MKTIIVLVALAAFGCLNSLHAQPLWEQMNGPGGSIISGINFDSAGGIYLSFKIRYGVHSRPSLRSTDNGISWSEIPNTSEDIKVLPNGHLFNGSAISADYGQTWTTITKLVGESTITTLGEIYINVQNQTPAHTYRSTDEGKTWDSVAVAPGFYLYAFYTPTIFSMSDVLYRSTDHGRSWGKVVNGLDHLYDWRSIAGDKDGHIAYIDDMGEYQSTDDGRTWFVYAKPRSMGGGNSAIAFTSNGSVLIGTDTAVALRKQTSQNYSLIGGSFGAANSQNKLIATSPTGEIWYARGTNLFKSNATNTRLSLVPLPTGVVWSLLAPEMGTLLVQVGDSASGFPYGLNPKIVFRATDKDTNWSAVGGPTYFNVRPDDFDSSHALLAGGGDSLRRSTDKGATWRAIGKQLGSVFVLDPSGYIFVGGDEGIFRSTDNGKTWDQLNYGLSDTKILSLTVNSSKDVFAGTRARIFRTSDHGLSWQTLQFIPPDSSGITTMVVNKDGVVFAGVNNGGVFWSHDGGEHWGLIGGGVSGKINALLNTPGGYVFVGTSKGVHYMEPGGADWVDANAGLSNTNVLSITRDPAGTIYLGTNGSGVFRSVLTYNGSQQAVHHTSTIGNDLTLNAVYPNPISVSGTLAFSIPSSSLVRVELLNALGETVKLLANENLATGSYSVPIGASDLANGVYHVRLVTSSGVKMQNVVVAR